MDIKIARETEYTPEWDENKKQKDPVVVKMHYLTPGERDSCYGRDGDKWMPDMKKLFLLGWVSCTNLNISEGDEKPKSTWTAQEILDTPGLEGLYAEISLVALKQNARQDLKN